MMKKILFQIALSAYINVLCYRNTKPSCTSISKQFNSKNNNSIVSHDALQRLLHMEKKWNKILRKKYGHLLGKKGGYLIIDDTVLSKPYSFEFELLSWLWSSSEEMYVYGMSLVLVIWTDGNTRLPIGFRLWKKDGKKTKIDLAMEILSDAKKFWKIKPEYVLMDSFYPAAKLLKRIREYGWHWIAKIKSNRLLEGIPVNEFFFYRFGNYFGELSENIIARVIKEDDNFWATSDLFLSPRQIKKHYQARQWVEEIFKILKSELRIEKCPARNQITQANHIYLTLFAFCQLEEYRLKNNFETIYQLRENLFNDPIPRNLQWN